MTRSPPPLPPSRRPPYMPFYGADFYDSEDVGIMAPAEECAYLRLLWRQWREGSLPSDPGLLSMLASKVGYDEVDMSEGTRLLSHFPVDPDGRRRNPRLEQHRASHLQISAFRSEAGKAGRAKQLAELPEHTPGKSRAKSGQTSGKARTNTPANTGDSDSYSDSSKQQPRRVPTWLTPFSDAWRAHCGATPNFGKLAKAIKPAVDEIGAGTLLERWTRYLAATEPRYCSASRFAETHGSYAEPEVVEMTDDFGAMTPHRKGADGQWHPVGAGRP